MRLFLGRTFIFVYIGETPSDLSGDVVASSFEVGSVKLGRGAGSNFELSRPLRLTVSTECKPEGPLGNIILGVLSFDFLSY